jgi:flagellar biosynthesis/type III secretory pathway protein FliH
MSDERTSGAVLRFDDAVFVPEGPVIKAHERQRWVALEQLRQEADVRIEQEIVKGLADTREQLERRSSDLLADAIGKLVDAFARAAGDLERSALDLAFEIASRVIDAGPPEAFFARAAEHLQALGPHGSALSIRVHPEATGSLAAFSERLRAAGVRHLSVVPDTSLTDRRSLVVQTNEGEIDLGCTTQLRRIVAEVLRRGPAAGDASNAEGERPQP